MEDAQNQPVEVDFKVNLSEPPQQEEEKKEEVVGESTTEETQESTEETVVESDENKPEQPAEETKEEVKAEPSREEIFNELLQDKYKIKAEDLENVLTKSEKQELPEEIEKYLEYRKETNRGLEDFMRLQQDYDNVDDGALIREYYRQTKNGLDDNDIESLIDVKFGYDEGADELTVKTKRLEMKEELYKAKQFFQEQKGKYATKLESSNESVPESAKEAVEFYQLYKKQQEEQSKRSESVRQTFEEKTSKLFNDEFKGFEFKIGDEKVVFKPKDVNEVRKSQSDLSNFINRHTDENGVLIDAEKYHTALSMAMNPEAYAKFFYEQGRASAIDNVVGQGKNIDMDVRSNVVSEKPGTKFRVVENNSPFVSGLKIKKR